MIKYKSNNPLGVGKGSKEPSPAQGISSIGVTDRGFPLIRGTDRYNTEWSLQDSSLATEACVWFGVGDPEIKSFRKGEGWKEYVLPDDVHVFARMHLTQEQLAEIMPHLERFIETGSIENLEEK